MNTKISLITTMSFSKKKVQYRNVKNERNAALTNRSQTLANGRPRCEYQEAEKIVTAENMLRYG